MTFTIPGRLPGLNEMNWQDRCGYRRGSKFKKQMTYQVAQWAMVGRVPQYHCPVQVHICFYEPNRRRDRDNIKGAVKYIMDGLKLRGVIVNDNQRWVTQQTEEILLDKDRPRIEVTIRGGSDEHRTTDHASRGAKSRAGFAAGKTV